MLRITSRCFLTKQPTTFLRSRYLSSSVHVFDVTDSTFSARVLQSKVPVVLDCHAEWCQPCKQLGPILEAEVKKLNGKVVMAKLDTDKFPHIAQSLQVKSLPTVMGVFQGKLVDKFVGAQSQAQVAEFVKRIAAVGGAAPGGSLVEEAESVFAQLVAALTKSEYKTTAEMTEVMNQLVNIPIAEDTPKEDVPKLKKIKAQTLALLIRVALAEDNLENGQAYLDLLLNKEFAEFLKEADIASAIATFKLAKNADPEASQKIANLLAKEDLSSSERLELAQALLGQGQYEEAMDQALTLLKNDRNFQDGAAKNLLLEIFQVLGPTHELTKRGRRKMSSFLHV